MIKEEKKMYQFFKNPLLAIGVNFGAGFLSFWHMVEPFCSFIAFAFGVVIGCYSLYNYVLGIRLKKMALKYESLKIAENEKLD